MLKRVLESSKRFNYFLVENVEMSIAVISIGNVDYNCFLSFSIDALVPILEPRR